MSGAFLHRSNERTLPADFAGDVLLWDIDKTYLETRFSSWRGLAAIPFEFAIDKSTVPGTVPLLRALRRGVGAESAIVPLYFVSGSPAQLRGVIERRMTLDGVDFDGITFKDQFGLVRAGRPRDVFRQFGYKLLALLLYRRELPDGARWLTFGDDVESDAEIFLLFGQICRGLRGDTLESRLRELGVHRADVREIREVAASLPEGDDPVERIFIHGASGLEPMQWADPRIVATRSYLQTVLVLYDLGRVRPESVGAVAKDLRTRGVSEETIQAHLADARERLGASEAAAALARRDTA